MRREEAFLPQVAEGASRHDLRSLGVMQGRFFDQWLIMTIDPSSPFLGISFLEFV